MHLLEFELASRSTTRSISRIFSMHSWNSRLFSVSDPCFVKYERKKFWGKFDHLRRPRPSCCRLKAIVKFIIEPISESSRRKITKDHERAEIYSLSHERWNLKWKKESFQASLAWAEGELLHAVVRLHAVVSMQISIISIEGRTRLTPSAHAR